MQFNTSGFFCMQKSVRSVTYSPYSVCHLSQKYVLKKGTWQNSWRNNKFKVKFLTKLMGHVAISGRTQL